MSFSFVSPIGSRYECPQLSPIWSPLKRLQISRELWLALATYQKQLGVEIISEEGLQQMKDNCHMDKIDIDKINEVEKTKTKHDIVAHIRVFSEQCPDASNFIHLGVTSNYINDNADMIIIKESVQIITGLARVLFNSLKEKSYEYKNFPTFAYTHFQKAQLTTYGKRFTLWNSDLIQDIERLKNLLFPFRGIKGTVGTQDSILKIFNGDATKCDELNSRLAKHFGFKENEEIMICGQTYSRKYDVHIFEVLCGIAQTIYKMMNDIRLLSGQNELFEFFDVEGGQVGSSAMPYKMNPITCENICGVCRYIIHNYSNISQNYINQWLERSLDDSSNRRIVYPETFLLLEHVLSKSINVINGLFVNKEDIIKKVNSRIQQLLCENIIIKGVLMGYERSDIHERLRKFYLVKNSEDTYTYTYILDIEDEVIIDIIKTHHLEDLLKDNAMMTEYIGRCEEQIDTFYSNIKY